MRGQWRRRRRRGRCGRWAPQFGPRRERPRIQMSAFAPSVPEREGERFRARRARPLSNKPVQNTARIPRAIVFEIVTKVMS